MSDKIKITVVSENGKLNNGVDDLIEQTVIMTHDPSTTIMSTLLNNNLVKGSFCGGRGDCGRCKIQFLKGATIPTALERSTMEPDELRQGYRLACMAKPKNDCTIRLALADSPKIAILSSVTNMTESIEQFSQQNLQTEYQRPNVIESGESGADAVSYDNISDCSGNRITEVTNKKETDVIIAVDLGTTTIAMQLVEMDTGSVIDTYCEMNPQRRYGADVLSRIQASCEGNRETLQESAEEVLKRGVERFRDQTATIRCMCIAGNTTMEHLLMGYDVSSLGSSPFTPVQIGLQEYTHPEWDFKVWLVPGISAFVGGDIAAGLYACGMLANDLQGQCAVRQEYADQPEQVDPLKPDGQDKITLLIDLGTNGEMAVTDGMHMIVTATAAGPAFEGGANAGIVGSDMIACTAGLLRQGILDETGLLAEPYFSEGVSIRSKDTIKNSSDKMQCGQEHTNYIFEAGRSESSLYITQKDIRSLQMAKAAVRAGVEVLIKQLEKKKAEKSQKNEIQLDGRQIERVYLAGGFGYYLDVEAAFRIGLLPEHMRGHVQAVGNSSLMGAYRIGRDLWQHKIDKRTLEESISSIISINLAKQEEFENLYIRYMNLSPEILI